MNEPFWLTAAMIIAIHDEQLAIHGGSAGLRDQGLLESALDRPRNKWAYEQAELPELAAAYGYGLARNHPFVDGNKRTGFVVGILFLELNGYRFAASEEDAAQAVLKLAAGALDEAGYSGFLRGNVARRKGGRY
jgi:death-on-curing protein